MRQLDLDLSSASLSTDSNPFVSSSTSSSPSGTDSSSGSDATSGSSSSGSSGSSGETGGSSGVTVVGISGKVITDYETAHGVIMGSTMVLLLPLGAMLMRLGASVYLHGAWQLFALCAMLCGFGLGIKLAQMRSLVGLAFPFSDRGLLVAFYSLLAAAQVRATFLVKFARRPKLGRAVSTHPPSPPASLLPLPKPQFQIPNFKQLYNTTHTIFGTVIIGLFLLQPIFGLMHHLRYRKTSSRAPISYLHIWYGRALMVCGIVNGGLGLLLARNSNKGMIGYAVAAGVVGTLYAVLVVLKRKGGKEVAGRDGGRRRRSSARKSEGRRREEVRDVRYG